MWVTPHSMPQLTPHQPHIWCVPLQAEQEQLQQWWRLLSPDEQKKAERYRFEKNTRQYIQARGILRQLLGEYLDCSPDSIEFGYNTYDKPTLQPENKLKFNVSHSGEMALLAFNWEDEIGVDIEDSTREIEIDVVAKHFFSPNEVNTLMALPLSEQQITFFNCWTRKEAIIKALGTGLAFPLNQFEVSMKVGSPARLLATHWDPEEAANWYMASFTPAENYIGAFAVRASVIDLQLYQWSRREGN